MALNGIALYMPFPLAEWMSIACSTEVLKQQLIVINAITSIENTCNSIYIYIYI
jgi:hypothetical protein